MTWKCGFRFVAALPRLHTQHVKSRIFCNSRVVGAEAAPEGIYSHVHLTGLRNEGRMSRFLMTGNLLSAKA